MYLSSQTAAFFTSECICGAQHLREPNQSVQKRSSYAGTGTAASMAEEPRLARGLTGQHDSDECSNHEHDTTRSECMNLSQNALITDTSNCKLPRHGVLCQSPLHRCLFAILCVLPHPTTVGYMQPFALMTLTLARLT